MNTRRDVYQSHIPKWTDAARPWNGPSGQLTEMPRTFRELSGLGATAPVPLPDFLNQYLDPIMATVREEAGVGAKAQVTPMVVGGMLLSAAALAASGLAIFLVLRGKRR